MKFTHFAPSRIAALLNLAIAVLSFFCATAAGREMSLATEWWWMIGHGFLALFLLFSCVFMATRARDEFRAAAFQANAIAIMKRRGSEGE